MRYPNGRIVKNYRVRGSGCCHKMVIHKRGSGILSTLVSGAKKLAKKHITRSNVKKVGNFIKRQGTHLLKKHKDKVIKNASDFAAKETERMFDDLKKGKKVKSVVNETKRKVKNKVKAELKSTGNEIKKDIVSNSNRKLLSQILMGNGIHHV